MHVMAAPAPSWCLLVLAVLLPLAVPGPAVAKNDAARLTCFYNSRANISCLWSQNGSSPAAPCFIRAWSDKRTWNKTCNLLPVRPGSWACNLILGHHAESQSLTAAELVSLSVTCCVEERNRTVASQTFKPFQNLRLMAPDSLQVVHVGIHRCNISWSVPQFSHYLTSYLQFEAQVRPLGRSWEETPSLALKQNQQWIFLVTLAADSLHEFRVRARTQGNGYTAEWSPWSQALAFRTRPAAPGKEPLTSWLGHVIVGLSGVFGFVLLVYLLANCQSFGPWLKKVLQCHIPDPSEFFSQLSSEHGGDFQDPHSKATRPAPSAESGPERVKGTDVSLTPRKWLSSPFPSSSFNPGGLAPEISPLEVLERDAKALKLLLPQQDKSSSPDTSGHSLASCFTNQGYFFFHLPDALEIEACQVYFTYDPCTEEPDEGGPGAPAGSPLPALLPLPGEDDAYCTFPPGEDLLLFSPSLLGGPGSPNTALGGRGADEERLPASLQGSTPGDLAPRPLETPAPGAPDLVGLHSPREAQEEAPAPSPVEARGLPWATLPGHGQGRVLTSHLPLNTDAYLSLQELQDQDPAHSV